MQRRFGGYAAIVTGGAQGIGAAIARRLAAEGARVLIADIDGDGAKRTADAIGRGAEGVRCDVGDAGSVQAAVDHAVSLYGGLDTLVNNAFRSHGLNRLQDLPEAEWLDSFDITLHGAYRAARAALPHLAAARGDRGAIVNIGSVNGLMGLGSHAYSAAKAALVSFTRTLAVEAAEDGVRVNLVAPGTVRTRNWDGREQTLADMGRDVYPLGRVGEPDDIAAAAAFLASADAAWITGITLPVDGGLTISNLGWTRKDRG